MFESFLAWVFLFIGIVTLNPTCFVASGTFAIAARIAELKGGEG